MMMISEQEILKVVSLVLALMIAIIGHEIMHGAAAYLCGDTTAKDAKRLSINPIRHIDPIGTIVVPLLLFIAQAPFLFGWAKPVPVDIRTIIQNRGYFGAIFVSLAGVAYNFTLAIVCASLITQVELDTIYQIFLAYLLIHLVLYNVVLGVFNLWPIPPLDGSQALGYLSLWLGSDKIPLFFNKIERFGFVILVVILISPLSTIFFAPIKYIVEFLLP